MAVDFFGDRDKRYETLDVSISLGQQQCNFYFKMLLISKLDDDEEGG